MRNLKYQEMQEKSYVFKYGDIGDSFYIVISGNCQIIVPVPVVVEDPDSKPLGLLKIVLDNFNEIAWVNIENGYECCNCILNALKDLELDKDQPDLFSTV